MADCRPTKRVIITGGTGLLGRAAVKAFDGAGWDVIAVGNKHAHGPVMKCDLLDFDAVTKLVTSLRPNVIVHCAAERRLERVAQDPDTSRRLNVDLTRLLAQLCKKLQCWLLFVSSDYVFDGVAPPYTERAPTNPINEYGVQKRDAELVAREADWGCGVLRVPLLYGAVDHLDDSNVSHLVALLLERKPVSFDNVQIRFPTFVDDVAHVMLKLSEQKLEHCGLSGVWHWSGNEGMTMYQLVLKMAHALRLDASHVSPSVTPKTDGVRRPHNCQLDVTTLALMGIAKNTPFEEGVKQSFGTWTAANKPPA